MMSIWPEGLLLCELYNLSERSEAGGELIFARHKSLKDVYLNVCLGFSFR